MHCAMLLGNQIAADCVRTTLAITMLLPRSFNS